MVTSMPATMRATAAVPWSPRISRVSGAPLAPVPDAATATEPEANSDQFGGAEIIVTGRQVRELAVNGRNYLDLVKIVPGVVSTTSA